MPIMYLYDTTTNECKGVYDGPSAPAGTADAGVMFTDGREEWSGSAWVLPDAVKAADEREWRDAELLDTDKWAGTDRTMSAAMTTYRQELRDMPALVGFPNSHTRPTRPAGE